MGHLHVLLGGQKSGKSRLAARLAADSGRPVVVIAPATARDEEFGQRIDRHRADRPEEWRTIESFDLAGALARVPAEAFVIVDALDTWLLEVAGRHGALTPPQEVAAATAAEEAVMAELDGCIDAIASRAGPTVVIAGQPGLGPIGADAVTRRYVDLHGLATQRLAAGAERTELVVAGGRVPVPRPGPGRRRATFGDGRVVAGGAAASPRATRDGRAPRDVRGDLDAWLAELVAAITPADAGAARAARRRHARLAKPPGSLGYLEEIGAGLAAIAGRCPPPVPGSPALLVAAGDHGVHRRGVSAWPQELSAVVAEAILDGGATAGVLARHSGAEVVVLDAGLASGLPDRPGLRSAAPRRGTRDLAEEAALTAEEAAAAIRAGADAAAELIATGSDLLIVGEVGIANTTPTAALAAALTGAPAPVVVGPGASSDGQVPPGKLGAVQAALARHGPDREPLRLLTSLGGLEHAALVGAVLAAARDRVPVLLDGVTTVVAAVVAARLAPAVADYLVAGHASTEPANGPLLEDLGLRPLLNLDLRLGEGTGGLLAIPLVQAAARVLHDVATLADLGLPDAPDP